MPFKIIKRGFSNITYTIGYKRDSFGKPILTNTFWGYNPKLINTLKESDFDVRSWFFFGFKVKEEDFQFPYKILWTDEANFSSE